MVDVHSNCMKTIFEAYEKIQFLENEVLKLNARNSSLEKVNYTLNDDLVKKSVALQEYKFKYENLQELTSRLKQMCQMIPESKDLCPISVSSGNSSNERAATGGDEIILKAEYVEAKHDRHSVATKLEKEGTVDNPILLENEKEDYCKYDHSREVLGVKEEVIEVSDEEENFVNSDVEPRAENHLSLSSAVKEGSSVSAEDNQARRLLTQPINCPDEFFNNLDENGNEHNASAGLDDSEKDSCHFRDRLNPFNSSKPSPVLSVERWIMDKNAFSYQDSGNLRIKLKKRKTTSKDCS